ncbi:unnamed protein product [Rotaria sp. Silwood1]|nr:unnamed protein product [Rotaria sp. Silwood1]CAF4701428.1 unnamed protein product [Rotaria sp. Silwood1]
MATTKRKYTIIAQTELDHENPIINGKKIQDRLKKSKGKTKSKINDVPTLSRWPGDVSNTFQRYTNKNKVKTDAKLNFCQLPDEIILIILSYLNKTSLVAFIQTCRRNRAIGYHPSLWRRIDMSYRRVDIEQINSLLQRGTMTLKMYQTTIQDSTLTYIEPSALCHLDLTSAILPTELLINLLSSCNSLRKLSLESLPLNYKIIEKIVLHEQLDTLNLAMCTGLTFECCQLITNKLSLLRCLNIAWTELTSESVKYICETISRCIEELNISGQRYNLTDDYIQLLVRRALRLRVLDISDSVLITDQSIIALRQHSRLLAHLSASRCYLLTPAALITLKLLPAFTILDIFGTLAQISLQQLYNEFGTRIRLNMCLFSNIARPTTGIQRTSIWGLRTRLIIKKNMEPSKVKERYQALKHQGPTRSLTRCDSTDLIPQVVSQNQINVHSHICPRAPEVLFESRTTYFNGINDDQDRPLSARVSSASITRQLSNVTLNDSKLSSIVNSPLHIRYRPIDLSSILPIKDNKMRIYASLTNSKQIDYFNSLSDELILTILRYLPRASLASMAQVCRRLRSLTYDPSLWCRVDMSRKHIESCYLRDVLLRGTIILKMYQTTVFGNSIYSPNRNTWFTKLQFLDLTLATISSDCLLSLMSACRSLRKLSLETLPLNLSIFEKLALNSHLDTLNLTMCTGIDLDCCSILTSQMKHLRYLNLGWTQLSDQCVHYICRTIQSSIEQITLTGFRQGMTDECVENLTRRAVRLRVLDLSDSSLITDKSVTSVIHSCLYLEQVAFSRCYAIAPIAYASLKQLRHLVSLDIFGVVDERGLQKLHSLLGSSISLNQQRFSYVARPTYGLRRTSIWGLRTRS